MEFLVFSKFLMTTSDFLMATPTDKMSIMLSCTILEDMGSGLKDCSLATTMREISDTFVIGDFIPPVIQIVHAPESWANLTLSKIGRASCRERV